MTTLPSNRRIDRGLSLPYYEQLKQLLIAQIADGTLRPGDLVPPEWELCEQYRVSRTVVRQALTDLVNERRLYRIRGKGTFVTDRPPREQFMETTVGFFEDFAGESTVIRRRILAVESVVPPPEVREALGLAQGQECVRLDRIREVEGAVSAYTQHYLPVRLRSDLLTALRAYDLENSSIYQFYADACGVTIRSGHRTLEAVAAPRRIARLLETKPGAPTLYVRSVGREAGGDAVEFFEAWHRGDRTQFDIDVGGPTRSGGVLRASEDALARRP
jgi:GntR family transcriptional regulator